MTFRSTCLLILLLATTSPTLANGPTTADPSVTSSGSSATSDPPTTLPATTPAQQPQGPTEPPSFKCPHGGDHTGECDSVKCTTSNSVCYRNFHVYTEPKMRCCDKLTEFCPVTKMISRHSFGSDGYLYGFVGMSAPSGRDFGKEWYHRVFMDSGKDGVACPIPYSFTQNKKYDDQGLPVDWDTSRLNENGFTLKTCTKNADCSGDGQFCDFAYNPSFDQSGYLPGDDNITFAGLDLSDNGKPRQFCYKLPPPEPNMKHVVEPENVGLKLCNYHVDCGDETQMCYLGSGKFRTRNETFKLAQGVCMQVDGCKLDEKDAVVGMVVTRENQFCNKDDDCQNAGLSRDNTNHNPHCRSFLASNSSMKLCCFEKNPVCRKGITETPYLQCTEHSQCANTTARKNHWCDDGNPSIGQCCYDPQSKRETYLCPDQATPLFNEPMCKGYDPNNADSGSCPKKGGLCRHGHCCPPLVISPNVTSGSNTKLGKDLYRTNYPCNVTDPLPTGFSYAFCEKETKKIIVIGRFHENGDKMTRVSGSTCTTNNDCANGDGSQVCVYENDATHLCYYNPLRPLRPEVSSFWKIVLIVSLSCGAIFLISTIVCFVCYRSKSVFDKYKKKGKKGKDGKGGKSSSSTSKSKGKGKDSKKKGGDKKGKKGKGKSTSSKSSKKGDASETGKSDMTDVTGTTGTQA